MVGATTTGDTPERALQLAQLEQVQLENEKLKLELAELREGKLWYHILTQMVPISPQSSRSQDSGGGFFNTGTSKQRTGLRRRTNPSVKRRQRNGNS